MSRWLMRAIETDQVVTISHDYFRLRRPLERRLYEIARKHCGSSPKWQIGLANLQNKTGSNAPIKRFRHNLRDYHALRADWLTFAQEETARGNPPKNPGAAFVAYCKRQETPRD
ncbi:Replication initiator protein A [Salmonella enterica subsp. enterica serovar Typhi]|nr:Replication initiator protein A [Salmonella enterica subsp. enterica serovar Typhi]